MSKLIKTIALWIENKTIEYHLAGFIYLFSFIIPLSISVAIRLLLSLLYTIILILVIVYYPINENETLKKRVKDWLAIYAMLFFASLIRFIDF